MGLDAVELLLTIEQRFGITLDENESMRCDTPRLLIDLVYSKLPHGENEVRCISQRTFYLLRQAIQKMFNIQKSQIRPTTQIRDIFEHPNQKQEWLLLQKRLQARSWPELVRPTWLNWFIMSLMIFTFVEIFVNIKKSIPDESIVVPLMISIIGTFFCGYLLGKITIPFKNRIPLYSSVLKNLVPFAQTSENILWANRNEVAKIVKSLIIQQLAINESDYFEDAKFVEDLGMY